MAKIQGLWRRGDAAWINIQVNGVRIRQPSGLKTTDSGWETAFKQIIAKFRFDSVSQPISAKSWIAGCSTRLSSVKLIFNLFTQLFFQTIQLIRNNPQPKKMMEMDKSGNSGHAQLDSAFGSDNLVFVPFS